MLNWIVWNRTNHLYKMDLALNNLERLICHKIKTNKRTKERQTHNDTRELNNQKKKKKKKREQ